MLLRIVSLALLAAGLPAALGAQESALPLLGFWVYDAGSSDLKGFEVTYAGDVAGELTMADSNGQRATFRIDGREYPQPYGSTATWKADGEGRLVAERRLNGNVYGVEHYAISPDQQQLVITMKNSAPTVFDEVWTLTRTSGTRGLVGTWQEVSYQNDRLALEFTSTDGKSVAIRWHPWDDRADLVLDGPEGKVRGPLPLPEMTFRLTRTGPRTFELVQRQFGKPLSVSHLEVSSDGRILTQDQKSSVPGARAEMRQVFRRR